MCFTPFRWINANESWIWHKKCERSLYSLVHFLYFHCVVLFAYGYFHFEKSISSLLLFSSLFLSISLTLSLLYVCFELLLVTFGSVWFHFVFGERILLTLIFPPAHCCCLSNSFSLVLFANRFLLSLSLGYSFFPSFNIGHGSALKATRILQITFILYNAQRIHT